MKSDLLNKGYTVDELTAPAKGAYVYFVDPQYGGMNKIWYTTFATAKRSGKKLGVFFRAAVAASGEFVV